MANRQFAQFRYSLEKQVVDLYLKVTIGATGAPTLTWGKGVASVVRDSAGLYTITLSDTYNKLLMATATILVNGTPTAPAMNVKSETVATTKLVVLQFMDLETPGVTELGDGEVVLLHLALSNTSAI